MLVLQSFFNALFTYLVFHFFLGFCFSAFLVSILGVDFQDICFFFIASQIPPLLSLFTLPFAYRLKSDNIKSMFWWPYIDHVSFSSK